MLTLYHLAISHFSEKARWALDAKGLPYRSRLLMPGYHMLTARRVAGTSTVPFLTDSDTGAVINDSTDILHYLDRVRAEPALFPRDDAQGARASEIEAFFDEHCARHVAGFAYHHVLDAPEVLAASWTSGLSWPRRVIVRASVPVFRRAMRRMRNISAETARRHREQLLVALEQLAAWLHEAPGDYLVGETFSAADLAAATLLGPVVRPEGSPWELLQRERAAMPVGFPPPAYAELLQLVAEHETSAWVRLMWQRHRRPTT